MREKFTCKKCKKKISSELLESIHTKTCKDCRDKKYGYSTLANPTPQHMEKCKKCQAIQQAQLERAKEKQRIEALEAQS